MLTYRLGTVNELAFGVKISFSYMHLHLDYEQNNRKVKGPLSKKFRRKRKILVRIILPVKLITGPWQFMPSLVINIW